MYPNANLRPGIRRIALVTLDHLGREALFYALNACQRMDARLDVLTNLPAEEIHQMVVRLRGTMDIPWRVIEISDKGDDVFHYASTESGLLFLASSIGDEKARRLRDESRPNGLWPGISWVVVEGR